MTQSPVNFGEEPRGGAPGMCILVIRMRPGQIDPPGPTRRVSRSFR